MFGVFPAIAVGVYVRLSGFFESDFGRLLRFEAAGYGNTLRDRVYALVN